MIGRRGRRRVACLRGTQGGAGSIEYLGMTVVAAVLIASVATAFVGAGLGQSISTSIDCALSAGQQCAASGEVAVPDADGSNGGTDRRDAQRDAGNDRRDDRDDDVTQPAPSTDGPPPTIGSPVSGTTAEEPDPPPWQPVDPGAGEHDSKGAGLNGHLVEFAAEAGASAMASSWPEASRNLLHFLGNSGEPLEQDVDQMLTDVPEFQEQVDLTADELIAEVVARAQEDGVTGPVTFPVSTNWTGFGYENGALVYDNNNWFYALGGWQSSQTGTITVIPPSEPGGPWRYTSSLTVHIRDQYNWDGTKSTQIGPLSVSDEQLAELHRKGLAQEFTAIGRTTSTRSREGIIP